MRWLQLAGGAAVILAAAMALVGALLPKQHHATRRARFRQTPEMLYAVLAGEPGWRSDVKAWGEIPSADGRKVWWEQDGHGKKIRFELVEDSPPWRRAVRIADQGLPFGGTWRFEITPAADGAELRIHEDGEIYNVIFRFLARFVFGYTGSIEGFLRDLGKKFGEHVVIEA